jgi:hypothetical protein
MTTAPPSAEAFNGRFPWFGTDIRDPIPLAYSKDRGAFFSASARTPIAFGISGASPRAVLPAGHLEGCTVRVRAKVSAGALLQVGFDYRRNSTIEYGSGGNNHGAGASNWYLPSDDWQDAVFTDTKR